MKMIGSVSRRNRSDKLRYLLAADLMVHQHAIPAIAGRHLPLISELHDRRRLRPRQIRKDQLKRTQRHNSVQTTIRTLRTHKTNRVWSGVVDHQRLPRSKINTGLRLQAMRLPVDENSAPLRLRPILEILEHVQDLVRLLITQRRR